MIAQVLLVATTYFEITSTSKASYLQVAEAIYAAIKSVCKSGITAPPQSLIQKESNWNYDGKGQGHDEGGMVSETSHFFKGLLAVSPILENFIFTWVKSKEVLLFVT